MKKNYVLDTNVLIHDPRAIFKFEDNNVIIPIFVLEEIDSFKKEGTERGRNARSISRTLDDLRGDTQGSLAKGVVLETGGTLRIVIPNSRPDLGLAYNEHSQDQAILQTAIDIRDKELLPTVFVTMDTNLRIRADAMGVQSETYENQRVEDATLEKPFVDLDVTDNDVDSFYQQEYIQVSENQMAGIAANAAVMLCAATDKQHTGLGKYDMKLGRVKALKVPREGILGVRPRNKEQSFAMDVLLDDNIRLVTLLGKAGTGKTLIALAAGLKQTVEDTVYTRLVVSRPIMPLGKDLGFLPGDVDEKLNPWMQPIFDNLEFVYSNRSGSPNREKSGFLELLESGMIQVEPLTYIRGRSLPKQYLIVDEAQNLTPHEVKTIITRCGEGTKIVLTGDPQQIDNPYVDQSSNGLSVVAERFRKEPIAAHVVLTKGERSELAEIAANLL